MPFTFEMDIAIYIYTYIRGKQIDIGGVFADLHSDATTLSWMHSDLQHIQ